MKVPKSPSLAPAGPVSPAEAVRGLACELCGLAPGVPCSARGDHVVRWLAGYAAGAISREDLKAAIGRLVVIAKWQVVPERAA